MGNLSPDHAALIGGAALGTVGSATAMAGLSGTTSVIAGVTATAMNLPVVGGAVGTGVSLAVAAAPVVVPVAVVTSVGYGVYKLVKWISDN